MATLTYQLTELLREPARLARLKQNAERLGKPLATFDIARNVLGWAHAEGRHHRRRKKAPLRQASVDPHLPEAERRMNGHKLDRFVSQA